MLRSMEKKKSRCPKNGRGCCAYVSRAAKPVPLSRQGHCSTEFGAHQPEKPKKMIFQMGSFRGSIHRICRIPEKWPQYASAVDDMMDRTSTDIAPWHIVASNDKLWSRIEVLKLLCDRLESAAND